MFCVQASGEEDLKDPIGEKAIFAEQSSGGRGDLKNEVAILIPPSFIAVHILARDFSLPNLSSSKKLKKKNGQTCRRIMASRGQASVDSSRPPGKFPESQTTGKIPGIPGQTPGKSRNPKPDPSGIPGIPGQTPGNSLNLNQNPRPDPQEFPDSQSRPPGIP